MSLFHVSESTREVYFGCAISIAGLLLVLLVIPSGIQQPQRAIPFDTLRPDLLPDVIAWGLVILGAVLAGLGYVQRSKDSGGLRKSEPNGPSRELPQILWRVSAACTLLIAYYVAIQYVGIVVSSIAAWIAFALLYEEYRLTFLASISCGVSICLYVFFVEIADVPLPIGSVFGG